MHGIWHGVNMTTHIHRYRCVFISISGKMFFCRARSKPKQNLTFDHYPTLQELEQIYFETILEKYSGHRSSVA
jgi:hypothetical protein